MGLGLEKWLNVVSRADWAILVGSWETAVPRAMWAVEAQLKSFQKEPVSEAGLETILDILAKRYVAAFSLCPKNLPETQLKVMD